MAESNAKRIIQNTAFLYIRMLIVMLINIFSVRFVLKGLGVVDYGVYNVVAGLVSMFSSLSSVMSSATLRFHSYAMGEGNEKKTSEIFSASFNIYAMLALSVLVVGEAIGIWFVNYKAEIPVERMSAANWVFQFATISFIISLFTAPFSSIVFASERMKVFSIISVLECVLKFVLAYSLLFVSCDHLMLYGSGILLINALNCLAYIVISKRGKLKFHYKRIVEKSLYKQMLSFSGWTLFSSSASLGISQLCTMITNVYFGPVVNASRAIAFQINSAMSSFTSNIVLAVKPPMIKCYAEGDYGRVSTYFEFCNKFIFYCLLFVLLPVFFEMETVLKIWLDVDNAQMTLFSRMILIYGLILSLNNPIAIIIQATGNIRNYSTFVEIPTLLCFPITWILYALGFPAESAFSVMILAILMSHIIRLICLKNQFNLFSYKKYIIGFVLPSIAIVAAGVVPLYFITTFVTASPSRLVASTILCAMTLLFSCLLFGFTKNERKMLLSLLKRK